MTLLLPHLEISEASADALRGEMLALLAEDWEPAQAGLIAPDLVLDLCAQYIANTRRASAKWGEDELAREYLRQMRGEGWATLRRMATRPRRGSALTRRLFLALVDAAAKRRERAPLGQRRAMMLVSGAYLRALLGVGQASVYPLNLPLTHRDLRRRGFDFDTAWTARASQAALRRHVEAGGLAHGPSLIHAWRLGYVALAIARRGAVALARARGEDGVDRACFEQALQTVESHLLAGGQLWQILSRTSLVKDIAEKLLGRGVSVGTLLSG